MADQSKTGGAPSEGRPRACGLGHDRSLWCVTFKDGTDIRVVLPEMLNDLEARLLASEVRTLQYVAVSQDHEQMLFMESSGLVAHRLRALASIKSIRQQTGKAVGLLFGPDLANLLKIRQFCEEQLLADDILRAWIDGGHLRIICTLYAARIIELKSGAECVGYFV